MGVRQKYEHQGQLAAQVIRCIEEGVIPDRDSLVETIKTLAESVLLLIKEVEDKEASHA